MTQVKEVIQVHCSRSPQDCHEDKTRIDWIYGVTIELQSSEAQTAFNLKRWNEVLHDPELARLPHRIETDRHGHIIITPPPAPFHGQKQQRIGSLLERLLPHGIVLVECPLSTSDGVKATDVAWVGAERTQEVKTDVCLDPCA